MPENRSIDANKIMVAKQKINGEFPPGQFVAMDDGEILADATTHRLLVEKLKALGRSPKDLLVLQAGVDYPDSALILCHVLGLNGHDA